MILESEYAEDFEAQCSSKRGYTTYIKDHSEETTDPKLKHYVITVENLSFNQPLSPVVFAAHQKGLKMFHFNMPASDEIVEVAENGNPEPLANALRNDSRTEFVEVLSNVPPQGTVQAMFTVTEKAQYISLASMAVNTNDCFVAINGKPIHLRGDDNTHVFDLPGLDAGSEENNELCSSIPGPACPQGNVRSLNGEGFVHVHRGFHGVNEDRTELAPEDLSNRGTPLEAVRYDWRNPMARVTIEEAFM